MSTEPTTVVLVDDAPEVRALVRMHLRLSARFAVVGEGASGLDAIALAAEHHPGLVLLDVSMPHMDGLEALPRILAVAPDTRVVLFSGFDQRGLAARGLELGAAGFLEKSLAVDRLADELETLLAAEAARADAGAAPATAAGRTTGTGRTTGDDATPPPDPVGPAGGAPGVDAPRGTRSDARVATGTGAQGDGEGPAASGPGGAAAPDAGVAPHVLAEDLERFREVFEEAAIGMATMTLAGQVVRANRALAGVVGRDVDRLVGVPYLDLVAARDADRVREVLTGLDAGRTEIAHVEHAPADDLDRRVAATIATVRGGHGRPLYLFLQLQDVTAQRRADEQLRRSEQRFRLLVEAVEDYAIFMLDPRGHVVSWNTGAQRIKGYTAEEIIGQHFRRFYPAAQQASGHPEHELRLALRDGHYEEEGWRVRRDGTTFWANVLITAVHDDAGEHIGFAKVTRDVTERRLATEQRELAAAALATAKHELEEMNSRLLRAAADQSQFLAVTAHELRTPVAVLGGSAGTLAQHWRDLDDDERTQLFDGMVTSAARLHRLLADLLTAARLEADAVDLDLQPVPVDEVLAAAAAAVAGPGPSAGDVVVDAEPGLRVVADRDRLAQAVDNLVRNALRHGAPPVRLGATARGGTVEIRVQDAGPGVAPAMRPRLFERFVTGERRGGTGLGLFIVRELARAQGGDAWYVDTPPTFVLSLPRA